jgi:hypothetical protein
MKTLFLTWQDPESRKWFPVARLTFDGQLYRFVYTNGALEAQHKAGFQPLWSFPRFDQSYESEDIFPLFSNRVMSPSRPEYAEVVEWLSLPQNEPDPMAFLARSGGAKRTDNFELLACPELDEEGYYKFHFLIHGLRYLPPGSIERINQLQTGERLLLACDFQNPFESGDGQPIQSNALILRTADNHIIGYCPGYLLEDAWHLLQTCEFCEVTVERLNPDAPLQFRLLGKLTASWPEGFHPFSTWHYQPISQGKTSYEVENSVAAYA